MYPETSSKTKAIPVFLLTLSLQENPAYSGYSRRENIGINVSI